MDIHSKDLILILLGVLLGLPPSILVSRYYFKRAFLKNLTPYLMFHATPMSGMSPVVRNQMTIEFKSQRVQNLVEAQFVVINDGDKALRDTIEPLTLRWPSSLQVLDAEVVRRYPATLQAEANLDGLAENKLQIEFNLLNAREWFIVKLIADGHSTPDQWNWSIVADELPRSLKLKKLTLDDLSDLPVPTKERFVYVGISILFGALTYGVFRSMSALSDWGKINTADGTFSWIATGVLLIALAFFGLVSSVATIAIFSKAIRGLRLFRQELPNLPDDVVADVWRGHSAQGDAVERLRKANKQ